jgi:translocation and assembly module TamB
MDGTITLQDAVAGRVRLGELSASAHYDSLRLSLNGALRVNNTPALSATASVPIDLALASRGTRTIDEPLTGRIQANRTDLSLLEALFPDITRARGTLETDVQLTGTWKRPRLRGQVRMDGAALSLENLGIRLENATADIGLTGDSILVRRFGAVSGAATDTLGISGVIGITEIDKPTFNLRLAANNFLAVDKARSATLTLTTTTPITLTGSSDAARLRGAVRVDRGRVRRARRAAEARRVSERLLEGVGHALVWRLLERLRAQRAQQHRDRRVREVVRVANEAEAEVVHVLLHGSHFLGCAVGVAVGVYRWMLMVACVGR